MKKIVYFRQKAFSVNDSFILFVCIFDSFLCNLKIHAPAFCDNVPQIVNYSFLLLVLGLNYHNRCVILSNLYKLLTTFL